MKGKNILLRVKLVLFTSVMIVLFGSFTAPEGQLPVSDSIQNNSKKEVMLSILESLESGKTYSRNEAWGGDSFHDLSPTIIFIQRSDDSEFKPVIELPDLNFECIRFEEIEERLEQLEESLELRIEEMIRRFEKEYEGKHRENHN